MSTRAPGDVKVDPSRRVGFDGGEDPLSPTTGGMETREGTRVGGEVLLVLAFEFLDEVVDEPIVEIFTT